MAIQVTTGATLQCSFGAAPSSLVVLPLNRVMAGGVPAATIMDHIPFANIATFGMCSSIANPTVATATAAALGVLTPMPCVPATPAPWLPGAPTVLTGGQPTLDNTCKLMCLWAGVIQIVNPGQMTVAVP
jgi:Domain of unknown function (DUF4280)